MFRMFNSFKCRWRWRVVCYEHVWNLDWNFILSAKVLMKTSVIWVWRTIYFRHFDRLVHICSLNQIFSLCYLFSEHASDIIFDFHRDERCKLHTRKRSASRKKQNRSIRDDRTSSARNLSINQQWRFIVSSTTISRSEFCETKWHSVKRSVETNELLVEIRE